MGTNDWLAQLKEGDTVLAIGRSSESVRRVQRLTATLIVLDNGDRFNRKYGSSTGTDAWTSVHLAEATPEHIERIRTEGKRQRLAQSLSRRNWLNLPLPVLEEINAVLENRHAEQAA
jgi:hypothetical protein